MSARGQFGVVSGPRPGAVEDNRLDQEALPGRMQAALEADDFVIYGKASIEQYDTDDVPTLIEMDALEGALGRFFESETAPGVISLGHDDVIVGRPLRSYTLEEAASVPVGGETYEFAAGEELTAHVEDADGDGKPELWLPAQIDGDTEMGMRARLQAMAGDLNGYSVTVRRNEAESTDEGRRITACDLHAVTLGSDQQIKNKGSEFGVAEFKAMQSGLSGLVEDVQRRYGSRPVGGRPRSADELVDELRARQASRPQRERRDTAALVEEAQRRQGSTSRTTKSAGEQIEDMVARHGSRGGR